MRRAPYARWLQAMYEPDYDAIPRSRQFQRFLIRFLRHPDARVRYLCAHHGGEFPGKSQRLRSALIARAADPHEHPVVRGQCLEFFHPSTPRLTRRAENVTLQCLGDPDANVRFWACFATHNLDMLKAVPRLRELTGDPGVGDMGRTVAYEAEQALNHLAGRTAWDPNKPPPTFPHPYPSLWR